MAKRWMAIGRDAADLIDRQSAELARLQRELAEARAAVDAAGREGLSRGLRLAVRWHVEWAVGLRAEAQVLPGNANSKRRILTVRRAAWHESSAASIDALPLPEPSATKAFDLVRHLHRQREFSARTFGPGTRTAGVIDHIRKELCEVERDPADLTEWVDVILLAMDGAWRAGHKPEAIADAIDAKQTKNEARDWPDWRTMPTDSTIEHKRAEPSGDDGGVG